jgi:hypothetical protein
VKKNKDQVMAISRKLAFKLSTPVPKRLFRPFPNYSADGDMDSNRFIDIPPSPWGWKGSASMLYQFGD